MFFIRPKYYATLTIILLVYLLPYLPAGNGEPDRSLTRGWAHGNVVKPLIGTRATRHTAEAIIHTISAQIVFDNNSIRRYSIVTNIVLCRESVLGAAIIHVAPAAAKRNGKLNAYEIKYYYDMHYISRAWDIILLSSYCIGRTRRAILCTGVHE